MRPPSSTYSRALDITGRRCRAASSTVRRRSLKSKGLGNTITPSTRSLAMVEKARSSWSPLCTSTYWSCTFKLRAEASDCLRISSLVRSPKAPGCQRPATLVILGRASLRRARRLGTSSGPRKVNPVRLPPGLDRLWTSPSPTGSPMTATTMGMVRVAHCASRPARMFEARMMSDLGLDELGSERGEALHVPTGQTVLDGDVLPLHVAALAQSLEQRGLGESYLR